MEEVQECQQIDVGGIVEVEKLFKSFTALSIIQQDQRQRKNSNPRRGINSGHARRKDLKAQRYFNDKRAGV